MKKVKILIFIAMLFLGASTTFAGGSPISLTATGGTLIGNYTTLGAAFTAINAGTHTGAITIVFNTGTTELATASLDSSGNGTGSNYTSIKISTVGNNIVAGAIVGPLVTLNGADNVTIDGLFGGVQNLTFNNTGTGAASTIKYINDASNNVIKNCIIKGAETSLTSGVILFSTGFNTGNDNNTISTCNIDGTGLSYSCLYSAGTTTTASTQNSNDTLKNCNIYDYFNSTITSPVGAFLSSGNTDWVISGNSFYQTVARSTGSQGVHTGLQIFPSYTSDEHFVIGNYVGGSGPLCAGTMSYTASSTNVLGAIGFSIQTGGPTNLVQGNFAKNITVTYASTLGSFGNAGYFGFIGGYNGTSTFNLNTVDNFNVTNSLGAALGSGIQVNGRVVTASTTVTPVFTVTNNTVQNSSFNTGAAASAAQWYGIRLETSSGASLTGATTISNPTFIVTGNTITNLNTTLGATSNWVRGIGTLGTNGTSSTAALWPKATIQNNNISNINCNSGLVSYSTLSAVGIQIAGSVNFNNTIDTFKVIGNTISNINATTTTDIANSAGGIQGTNSTGLIYGNRVYGITNSAPGTTATPIIVGINWRATFNTTSIYNNDIALGSGVTTNTSIFGVISNFGASRPIAVNDNSIYVTGSNPSGTRNSACLYRGNETFTAAISDSIYANNNLLFTDRNSGSGGSFSIASYGTGTWFTNTNALVAPSAGNIAFWNAVGQSFNSYKAISSSDSNSVSAVSGAVSDYTVTPTVINPTDLFNSASYATNGNLDIKTSNTASWLVNGKGMAIPTISTDFSGNARSTTVGLPTDIGAHEFTPSVNPPSAVESGSFSNGGTTTYTSFGKVVLSILWNNVGTITTRDVKYYPGVTPTGTVTGKYSQGYWEVLVNGGASGYNYNITLNFDPSDMGTTANDANLRMGKKDVGGPWNIITTSTPDNVLYTLTATGLTSFSQFALTDVTAPLPVELSSFTSSSTANKVTLNWSTVSEQNNSGFDIERKLTTSAEWTKVGNVAGNGNSSIVRNYSFNDANVATGKYNYRLKQMDFNGNFNYHQLTGEVIVGIPTKFDLSQNYPNPFNPTTKINYNLPVDSKVSVRLFDMTGRQVAEIVNSVQTAGYYSVQFNASNLSSGTYFYTIEANNFVMTKKMMLVK